MGIAEIRTALADAASTITGLRCYDYVALKPELPAFVAGWPTDFNPRQVEGVGVTYTIPCHVLAPYRQDRTADKALMAFLGESGSSSIIAALEADPSLGGVCDSCVVIDGGATVGQQTMPDGTVVLVAEILVEVLT